MVAKFFSSLKYIVFFAFASLFLLHFIDRAVSNHNNEQIKKAVAEKYTQADAEKDFADKFNKPASKK